MRIGRSREQARKERERNGRKISSVGGNRDGEGGREKPQRKRETGE